MRIIYYAHSYRPEDSAVTKFFSSLIRDEELLPSLDPPSDHLNSAKPERHLRATDGMIAVLTVRGESFSRYIMYEIVLAMRTNKPLLVFVEDVLPDVVLPTRILQRRFSRKGLLRQIRDLRYAIKTFKTYIGDEPPPKYQPSLQRRRCILVGTSVLDEKVRSDLSEQINHLGYTVDTIDETQPLWLYDKDIQEVVTCADFAIGVVDSRHPSSVFSLGVIYGALLPKILLSINRDHKFNSALPTEYQVRVVSPLDVEQVSSVVTKEIQIMEEEYVDLEDQSEVEKYTDLLIREHSDKGRYSKGVREVFVKELVMGDQYNNSGNAGAMGPNSQGTVNVYSQAWQQLQSSTDLNALAQELTTLRLNLTKRAETLQERKSLIAVEEAEEEAKNGNGPKVLENLKKAGEWVLGYSKEIGVKVATEAIKHATGISS